ncbi:Outer membrane protein OmpA [Geopseudomonas sagittaria]|uniref:Outer membrane protein OmpA n=1 Tax=Geopseudomonas sagittaria TaxID=1135990 RepID=A0A1I5TZ37_9GAMM|nr:OmpA family protein [Pseudomonas sagittaria]MCM2330516.1 OmpA family protein [Pseudomonas sagittaria]SFP87887.1 Outer membrane protein OmpA [Pseudomonas sagittaria]
MSLVKPAALFLCVALAGCAGKSGSADTSQKEPGKSPVAEQAAQTDKLKASESKKAEPARLARAAKAPAEQGAKKVEKEEKKSSWWSFGAKGKESDKPAQAKQAKAEATKVTAAWLDEHEARLKAAVAGSKFEVERRGDVLVVVAPVDPSFNPDRPHMLLPVTLGPLSRLAKLVAAEGQMAVLVVGHADSRGDAVLNRKLSLERAQALGSIFRMSGLKGDRLMLRGVGSDKPRATNDSVAGRASNRRVEVLVTVRDSLPALVAQNDR